MQLNTKFSSAAKQGIRILFEMLSLTKKITKILNDQAIIQQWPSLHNVLI